MARLPDRFALGERDPRSVRGIAQYPMEDPVATATQNLGRAVAGAGADVMRLGMERQQTNDQLELARARSGFNSEAIRLRSELEPDQDYQTLTPRVEQRLSRSREQWAQRIRDPRIREQFLLESADDFERNRTWAVERSRGLERDRGLASFQERATEGQTLFFEAQDDAERARLVSGYAAEVDAMIEKGWITATDGQRLKEDWQRGAALTYIQSLPAEQRVAITRTPVTRDERVRTAFEFFRSKGWSDAQAAAIVGNAIQESNLNPNARNPGDGRDGSDSIGLFQWNSDRARRFRRFAEARNTSVDDFQTQLEFFDLELRTSEGARGNALIASGDVDAATAAVISALRPAGWTSANPRGGHAFDTRLRNAQEVLAAYAGGEAPPSVAGSEYVRYLTPAQRVALTEDAQRELRAQDQVRRAEFESGFQDYTAYLRSGGAPRPEYSPTAIAAAMGDQADVAIREVKRAEAFGADVRAIQFASPEEIGTMVAERAAMMEQPEEFRANAQDLSGLRTAIEQRQRQIEADPAGYVAADPGVQRAYQSFADAGTAEAARAYAAASLAMQERIGVPRDERRLLPEAFAEQIADGFRNQPEGGQNAARQMQALAQTWGRHWPDVFAQLAEGDRIPDVVKVIGTMTRPSQMRAAEALAEAAMVGKSEFERPLENAVKSDLEMQINEEFEPFAASLAASPTGQGTANAFAEAGHLLALAYMRQGDSPSKAAERAYTDIIGRAYHPIEGQVRIPIERDRDAVDIGAQAILADLDTIRPDVPRSMFGLPDDITREQYLSALSGGAFWVTAPGDTGLMLYQPDGYGGSAVTVDGTPYVVTWDELEARGTRAADPQSPEPLTPQAREARDAGAVPQMVDPALDALRREIEAPQDLPQMRTGGQF